jgi:hypothetical protein
LDRAQQAEPDQWQNRSHYLAVAAQAMRRILIDYAVGNRRSRAAQSLDPRRRRNVGV